MRTRQGGRSRKRDIAESDRNVVEISEELLGDREELLMPRRPQASDEEPDEVPVEDRPEAGVPSEFEGDLDGEGDPSVPAKGDLANVLCALLLSSREALSMLRLAQSTNTTPKQVAVALEELRETLTASGLPLEVNIAGEQVRLLTTPEVFGYLRNLRNVKKQGKLSSAALETLAVVAYRQPVMRAEIEAIRGVKAGPILRTLLEHRMIKVTGRADVPGRPLQYGTTQHFLETFGLENVKDLPSVKEFRSL
jgi:segregation and condensation protein B